MQLQAGYILQDIRSKLFSYAKENYNEKLGALNGLLKSLSTFELETNYNLEAFIPIPSIYAVAHNLITRGLPTIPSIYIEEEFSRLIKKTEVNQKEKTNKGKVLYSFIDSTISSDTLFKSLHFIENRAQIRKDYLDINGLDSNFEKDFLLNLVPEKLSFFTQIFQQQRSRSSLTRDNNAGRLDFSIEIPYDIVSEKQNRYRQNVNLKHRKTYIAEVDGAKYHSQLIDDLKDFEIAQLSTNVSHITEDKIQEGVNDFIGDLLKEEYIKIIEENYVNAEWNNSPEQSLTLSAFGIARIQLVIIKLLIANCDNISSKSNIKLAVIERDLPCAQIAVNDLKQLLNSLNDLSQTPIQIPVIELTTFSTIDFINHPLHNDIKPLPISEFKENNFDFIFDIALLRRSGIFKDDNDFNCRKSFLIRSSHYIDYRTFNPLVSAANIQYKPLVNPMANEVFEEIEETKNILTVFLQNIFRNTSFRTGQLPILNRALQNKTVIGLLPTGGGKSLTYQLASLLQPGTTIVIDPIRSLMIDQYNGLKEIGIDKCEYINSTLTTAERTYNQSTLLAKGRLQFLFVSPERFVIDEFRIALKNAAQDGHYFAYAVIDEVHCVSEWGHDFRTPYLNLGENVQEYCKTFTNNKITLFGLTATASFDVLADIERELKITENENNDGNAIIRNENSVRNEISYIIKEVPITYEGLDNLTSNALKQSIGETKQEVIYNTIQYKESIFQTYNTPSVIDKIIKNSFNDYLPSIIKQKYIEKYITEELALQGYQAEELKKIFINLENEGESPFLINTENEKKSYNYGLIVFMPHRSGWLGIKNGTKSRGVFDNPNHVFTTVVNNKTNYHFNEETFGYFMGSGDDVNSELVDKESFEHLDLYKDNKESVMIATKAFGMGIDKPNVRMTIHMNIPQSIESFVQEAGRAGRDGKMSCSVVLYNNNNLLHVSDRPNEPFHLDKDILMYFHKNSFKGQIKERLMIYELRNKITFPNTNNLNLLTEQINDVFGNENIQFNIVLGSHTFNEYIFINTLSGLKIGFVNLNTTNTKIYNDFGDTALCLQLTNWLKSKLPFTKGQTVEGIRNWIYQNIVNTQQQVGIEKILSEMHVGDNNYKTPLPIPFTNRYYSKQSKFENTFVLNQAHLELFLNTQAIQKIKMITGWDDGILKDLLQKAVYSGTDYSEFIESLHLNDKDFLAQLTDTNNPFCLELQKVYYIPRAQDDTAKAIYRLISIGIIDSYTIDYQNKLYNVVFTKRADDDYFELLKTLIIRYTSKNSAKTIIEDLKSSSELSRKEGKSTVISICLEYLTDFIYDKIKKKRLQAIDDMVKLCQNSIKIPDPIEHNKFIKDEIYYYFNAKYSRDNFIESAIGEEASLLKDYNEVLSIKKTIDKYINLVHNYKTGELITNLKHLRGSTIRMIRSYDEPQFRILKAYSLFILADSIKSLVDEAKEELVKGLINWKQNENDELNVPAFIIEFKNKLNIHILRPEFTTEFDDIEDIYYSMYYASWIKKFNNRILENY